MNRPGDEHAAGPRIAQGQRDGGKDAGFAKAFLGAVEAGALPDMITITCKSDRIQEARVCLTKSLEPRPCGADVIRDCRMSDALLDPVR